MQTITKRVTIKTLAQILNVTAATVSKALRDSSDISQATKDKVKKLADELGYQPNYFARSLVSKQSNIIGIIVPDISTSFFGFTVRGINEAAREHSYETIILVNDENYVEERKNLEFLSKLQVDGIIIDSVPGEHNQDLITNLHDRGMPFVFIDRKCENPNISSVTTDDITVGNRITNYFIKSGRRKIAFVGSVNELTVAKERLQGYKNALSDSGIEFDKDLVIPVHYEIKSEDLKNQIRQFIKSGKEFDAIIGAGGLITYLTGSVLLEEGYSIPDDVLLGEFGDNNIVYRLGIPFVTVNQSPSKIGGKALDLLVNRLKNPDEAYTPEHVFIKSKLIYHDFVAHTRRLIEDV